MKSEKHKQLKIKNQQPFLFSWLPVLLYLVNAVEPTLDKGKEKDEKEPRLLSGDKTQTQGLGNPEPIH